MTLRVSGKNLAIGEALRTHVHERIDGLVAKYHAGSATGHVTIEPEGSGFRADCTLFLKAGVTLQVEALAHEPYATFDKAADRVERRLRDHRKRAQDKHADGFGHADGLAAFAAEAAALPPLGQILAEDGIDEDGLDETGAEAGSATLGASGHDGAGAPAFPAVVAEHADKFSEMTVAAAVRALDDGECPVVVFRYAENRRINVVYRRRDGNIGWIDPLGSGER